MSEQKSVGEQTLEIVRDMATSLGMAMQLIRHVVKTLQQMEEATTAMMAQDTLAKVQRPAIVTGEIPEVEGADRDGEGGRVVDP